MVKSYKEKSNIKFVFLLLILLVIIILSFGNVDVSKTAEELHLKRNWHSNELKKTREKLESTRRRKVRVLKLLRYLILPLSRSFSIGILFVLCFTLDWLNLSNIQSPADFILNFQMVVLTVASLNFIVFGKIANWKGSAKKVEDIIINTIFKDLPNLEKEEAELKKSVKLHLDQLEKIGSQANLSSNQPLEKE